MNREQSHKKFNRTAILLTKSRDDRGVFDIPSGTIVYPWASGWQNDEVESFIGKLFLPETDDFASVTLRMKDKGGLWDWYVDEDGARGTLLVPAALMQSIQRHCDAAIVGCTLDADKAHLMRIAGLAQLVLSGSMPDTPLR